jgi:hypothetical protein
MSEANQIEANQTIKQILKYPSLRIENVKLCFGSTSPVLVHFAENYFAKFL